eukprot:1995998-Rhodomonas_salina.1
MRAACCRSTLVPDGVCTPAHSTRSLARSAGIQHDDDGGDDEGDDDDDEDEDEDGGDDDDDGASRQIAGPSLEKRPRLEKRAKRQRASLPRSPSSNVIAKQDPRCRKQTSHTSSDAKHTHSQYTTLGFSHLLSVHELELGEEVGSEALAVGVVAVRE